jgi:hypothetical protein
LGVQVEGDGAVQVLRGERYMGFISPPWSLADTKRGPNCPVRAPGLSPGWADPDALSGALTQTQLRKLTAYHEAGHALAYECLGLPVRSVEIGTNAGATRAVLPHGTTVRFSAEGDFHVLVLGSLAGVVGSELWLEDEGVAGPETRLLAHIGGQHDYSAIHAITAPRPAVYYYGATGPRPPADMPIIQVDVDALRAAASYLLTSRWHAVADLAEHLIRHSRADRGVMERLAGQAATVAGELYAMIDRAVQGGEDQGDWRGHG